MNFKEILDYLEKKQESRILLGLDRVRHVLEALGNPQDTLRVIHVAGTNGKGSVCQMLYSVFLEAGFPAGEYSSPHLFEITERVHASGRAITEDDFTSIAERLFEVSGHERLTYFEFITCLAFVYFQEIGADPVLLETGLGGRFDATNVIKHPLITVITSIGLDHTAWLGASIEAIATEKAGIFKKGSLAILGCISPGIRQYLVKKAQETKAVLVQSNHCDQSNNGTTHWEMGFQDFTFDGHKFQLPFLGQHQRNNACLAKDTLESLRDSCGLKISNQDIIAGFRRSRITGRWDLRLCPGKVLVFDVAHNAQAIEEHLNTIQSSPWREAPKLLIAGFLKDKDYSSMLKLLVPRFQNLWLVEPESERACAAPRLVESLALDDRLKVKIVPSIHSAIELAKADRQFPFVSVLGSFRVVAPALEAFC